MKFTLSNLGAIDHAEIELGDLTIICGENNSGKTYATYGIFGFLWFWHNGFTLNLPDSLSTDLKNHGTCSIDLQPFLNDPRNVLMEACEEYVVQLPTVFAASARRFAESQFVVEVEPARDVFSRSLERSFAIGDTEFAVTKAAESLRLEISLVSGIGKKGNFPFGVVKRILAQVIKETLFERAIPRPFITSAERTGAAMFKNDLNLQRNRLLEEIGRSEGEIDAFRLLTKSYTDYPLPVKLNIDFARRRESILNQQSSALAKSHREILMDFEEFLGGGFYVDRESKLRFIPAATKTKLSMDESSSSVRSLLDLGLYLACIATPGDLLIIDEPELNLHPQNQRRVARLLARVVNAGVKVMLTTHSDYLVKEFNLLMLMNSDDDRIRRIAEHEKYHRSETLSSNGVRLYVAGEDRIQKPGKQRRSSCRTLKRVPITPERGIEVSSFDTAIDQMNRIEDALLYGELP